MNSMLQRRKLNLREVKPLAHSGNNSKSDSKTWIRAKKQKTKKKIWSAYGLVITNKRYIIKE